MRLVVKGGPAGDGGGGGAIARWSVEVGDAPVMIGRDKQCDLPLDDTNISRHHVVCHAQGGRLHIRDLGSRNGTYLNGAKVVDAVMLAGDEITVGKYRIRLETGEPEVPQTMVGATFTTSGASPGVAAVAGLEGDAEPEPSGAPPEPKRSGWEMGPVGAVAVTIVLLALAAAVIPLAREWRGESPPRPVLATGSGSEAWRAAIAGDTETAAGLVATTEEPAGLAVRDWIHAGGGLPADRPGAAQEIPALQRLLSLAPTALDPAVRNGVHARLARVQLEQRAGAAARRAIEQEASGDVEAAIATFESLGTWPESGAAKRHLGRAATLRARRCAKFRELGASNRAAGDWDGALRCFRTAARHARGTQLDLVAPELREAEQEVAALKALGVARDLAGTGAWMRAIAALDAAPEQTSQARRLAAMRDELERRVALRDAWAAYSDGDSHRARALLERWRNAGDAEATALWRRAGAAQQAFKDAELALAEKRWERAREGWATVLQVEPDDRVAWRRNAQRRLEEWPVPRVVAELRAAALTALEREQYFDGRGLLDRAAALDPAAVAEELDRLRTKAQLLYNTALNIQRDDPVGARRLYGLVVAMTRPGESKHAAAQAARDRLGK